MRDYSTKTARNEFVANWYRTVETWQRDLRKARS
jgi:DNA phosphorothioation-dependent restriction protein DptG